MTEAMETWIEDLCVKRRTGTKVKNLSLAEIWESRLDEYTTAEGWKITDYGHFEIEITSHGNNQVVLNLVTPGKHFRIVDISHLRDDYVAVNDSIVPLEENHASMIREILDEGNIVLDSRCTIANYAYLLSVKNQRLARIQIPLDAKFLQNLPQAPSVNVNLKLQPRPYQQTGIQWLCQLASNQIGGLLGDDMGLGKTLQLIGLLEFLISNSGTDARFLVIVPNSLKQNWLLEIKKFSNLINAYLHAGDDRVALPRDLMKENVVITTYDVIRRDEYLLKSIDWTSVICDEAHALKNPKSKQHQIVHSLTAKTKFLATGTPVENSLLDLWALMNIIRPGLMGSETYFKRLYEDSVYSAATLGDSVKPLILRRLADEVSTEMPELEIIQYPIEADYSFAKAYENLRLETIDECGSAANWTVTQKIRQFCCEPSIVESGFAGVSNPKLDVLKTLLEEINANDEKVLIFTSFNSSNDYLKIELTNLFPNAAIFQIYGDVSSDERFLRVQNFESHEGFGILIASPRTGGEGLNILSARHVVHFNLDWNPAKENQGTGRIRRSGNRHKTVFSHRFYYLNTVEDWINDKLIMKSELANTALSPAESERSNKSVLEALSISPL